MSGEQRSVFGYPGADVDVTWDRRLCIHVGECTRAKGEVFVSGRDPWGDPDRVNADEVADIVARAEDGKDTQMSVSCNFGELGDCGRKRYAVGHERNEYLFDVAFPDKQPGAAGTIAINSDFEGQGRAVDIYAIRVSVAE